MQAARNCDLLLVIGTSASVSPASAIPSAAQRAGATVVELNLEATALTNRVSDVLVLGRSGAVLPKLLAAVRRRRQTAAAVPRAPPSAAGLGAAKSSFRPR